MDRQKIKSDYLKTRNLILSCNNMDQLKVGFKMYNQLNKLHKLPEKYLDKLENLIGLMKIKCGSEINEEESSSYKDFKTAAGTSGTQELKDLVFYENEELKRRKS